MRYGVNCFQSVLHLHKYFLPVLRVHDILVWILIRGFMPLNNGYGFEFGSSDLHPAIFVIDLQDANKKIFLKKFFCFLLFESTFTSFFKDKKFLRIRIQIWICGSVILNCGSGSGRPICYGSGSSSKPNIFVASEKNILLHRWRNH